MSDTELVTAKYVGTATVTATGANSIYAQCKVTVKPRLVESEGKTGKVEVGKIPLPKTDGDQDLLITLYDLLVRWWLTPLLNSLYADDDTDESSVDAQATTTATSDKEKAENKRQKDTVKKIIEKSKYSISAWNKGTGTARTNNRKALLNQLIVELQKTMGTSAKAKIEWFDSSEENFGGFYSAFSGVPIGKSGRTTSANTMYINVDRLGKYPNILRYVAHELRHCYQYESFVTPGKHITTTTTNNKWKGNYPGVGTYNNKKWPDKGHVQQPVEWDAYYFAGQISKTSYKPVYSGNWY